MIRIYKSQTLINLEKKNKKIKVCTFKTLINLEKNKKVCTFKTLVLSIFDFKLGTEWTSTVLIIIDGFWTMDL